MTSKHCDTISELQSGEIDQVSGGLSQDTVYTAALGAAGGFLALAFAPVLAPAGVALMLGASIASSGIAISTVTE